MPAKINIDIDEILQRVRAGEFIKNIAADYKIHRIILGKKIKEAGFNVNLERFNHNFFEKIDTEEKAYWLGFIMADGCLFEMFYKGKSSSKRIILCINKDDSNHLLKFNSALAAQNKISYSAKDNCVRTSYTSKKMYNDLTNLGCTAKKSLTLKFPTIKKQLIRHFIRGYLDGDGSISFKDRNIKMNRNKKIHTIVLSIVGTLDMAQKISYYFKIDNKFRKVGSNTYTFSIAGNIKTMKILDWLYKNATIYLDRKYDLYIEHKTKLEKRNKLT